MVILCSLPIFCISVYDDSLQSTYNPNYVIRQKKCSVLRGKSENILNKRRQYFVVFRASRLVSEVGNVEKVKSASNSVDAIMKFILHRIETYIETPQVTIRKVRLLGFMPMWTVFDST